MFSDRVVNLYYFRGPVSGTSIYLVPVRNQRGRHGKHDDQMPAPEILHGSELLAEHIPGIYSCRSSDPLSGDEVSLLSPLH